MHGIYKLLMHGKRMYIIQQTTLSMQHETSTLEQLIIPSIVNYVAMDTINI